MKIEKVLVADAVDSECVNILKQYSIAVDCRYKLPKAELIEVIKVSFVVFNAQSGSMTDYYLHLQVQVFFNIAYSLLKLKMNIRKNEQQKVRTVIVRVS